MVAKYSIDEVKQIIFRLVVLIAVICEVTGWTNIEPSA